MGLLQSKGSFFVCLLTSLKILIIRKFLTILLVLINYHTISGKLTYKYINQLKEKVTEEYQDQGKCSLSYFDQMAFFPSVSEASQSSMFFFP